MSSGFPRTTLSASWHDHQTEQCWLRCSHKQRRGENQENLGRHNLGHWPSSGAWCQGPWTSQNWADNYRSHNFQILSSDGKRLRRRDTVTGSGIRHSDEIRMSQGKWEKLRLHLNLSEKRKLCKRCDERVSSVDVSLPLIDHHKAAPRLAKCQQTLSAWWPVTRSPRELSCWELEISELRGKLSKV